GVSLKDVALSLDARRRSFTIEPATIGNTPVRTLTVAGLAGQNAPWQPNQLYRELGSNTWREIALKLVPYYAWGNRGDTEMSVWLPTK
ncbi:MAG TPA: hypothetical protein VGD81_14815, partial [Opitutaceae bacterium]